MSSSHGKVLTVPRLTVIHLRDVTMGKVNLLIVGCIKE